MRAIGRNRRTRTAPKRGELLVPPPEMVRGESETMKTGRLRGREGADPISTSSGQSDEGPVVSSLIRLCNLRSEED